MIIKSSRCLKGCTQMIVAKNILDRKWCQGMRLFEFFIQSYFLLEDRKIFWWGAGRGRKLIYWSNLHGLRKNILSPVRTGIFWALRDGRLREWRDWWVEGNISWIRTVNLPVTIVVVLVIKLCIHKGYHEIKALI